MTDPFDTVRKAIDVDWYGPNPEYRPTIDAGIAALAEIKERMRAVERRVSGATEDAYTQLKRAETAEKRLEDALVRVLWLEDHFGAALSLSGGKP